MMTAQLPLGLSRRGPPVPTQMQVATRCLLAIACPHVGHDLGQQPLLAVVLLVVDARVAMVLVDGA